MADKNIQMTQRNATNDGWDNLYPETKAAIVMTASGSDVETELANMTSHVNTKEIHRKITFGTAEPTGGVDGDIYFQYV